MKKTFILLFISFMVPSFTTLFHACTGCGDDTSIRYRLSAIESRPTIVSEITDAPAYTQQYTLADYETGSIRYDSFGIEVIHQNETIAWIEQCSNSVFSAAYACDPAPTYEMISTVIMTSSEDYNEQFPKGTDLSSIMVINDGYSPDPLQVFDTGRNLLWRFRTPPSEAGTHTFTITYQTADGRTFETQVDNITIHP